VRDVSSDSSPDMLDLQVAEHGPDARVVTVVGDIDAFTAPELAAFLTAQLAVAQVVVVDLDGVQFMASAGLSALFEANELAIREGRALRLVHDSQTPTWRWKPPDCGSTSPSTTAWRTPSSKNNLWFVGAVSEPNEDVGYCSGIRCTGQHLPGRVPG
jgi:anti-anti-sigma factor